MSKTRPTVRPAEGGVKLTPVLLHMPLRRALEAAANARAMTMSAWIREAIKEKLSREESDDLHS